MGYVEKKRSMLFGLPISCTIYDIKEDLLTVETGFLNKTENDCYMYKIQDVQLRTSLFERIFKLGTVVCYSGDTTDPILSLVHIKNAREVKNYILEYSEKARMKRRTINTVNIGADHLDDLDGADN